MKARGVAKVTISISRDLLELADRLAEEEGVSRSEVFAKLLEKEEKARLEVLMAEGYRDTGAENRQEAEKWLELTREVTLRNG